MPMDGNSNGASTESLREASYQKKALAVEKFRQGSLGGASALAYVAKFLYPELPGLRRLNAVIDVLIGYEKKINGSVDWYAVLGVHPTETITNIRRRYRRLFLELTMDDDDSLDITYKANKILTDSWKFVCNEKGRELYDKRRKYQLREKNRRLRRLAFTPVVLAPAPPRPVFDEHMYQIAVELLGVREGGSRGEASTSTSVPPAKQRRRIRRGKPPVCLAMRNVAPEDLENENLVNTPKEEAVNGVVGSMTNVAADDDQATKNGEMESNKDEEMD